MNITNCNDILKNFIAGSLGQVINVVNVLFLIPVLLSNWGVEIYASWILIYTVPSYLSICDLGVGAAIGNEISIRKNSARSLFQNGLILLLLTMILLFVVSFIFIQSILSINANQLILVLILSFFIVLCNYNISTLRGLNLYHTGISINNIFKVIDLIVIFSFSFYSNDFTWLLVLLIISKILLFFLLSFKVVFLLKSYDTEIVCFSNLRKLIAPSLGFTIMPIAYSVNNQGLVWCVSLLYSPDLVVIFNTLRSVTRFIYQSTGVLSQSYWPRFSEYFSNSDYPSLFVNFKRLLFFSFCFILISSMLLFTLKYYVVMYIFKSKIVVDSILFLLFITINFFASIWQPFQLLLVATNNHLVFSILFLLSQVFVVVFVVVCKPIFFMFLLILIMQELFNLVVTAFLSKKLFATIMDGFNVLSKNSVF